MPSTRPSRVGDQIREEISELLMRDLHDPGIGFVTVTHVKVTADLQQARVYYTSLGGEKARRESARALARAKPFLRRQLGQRLRLRRTPELQFFFDESIERQDRIERILQEINLERAEHRASEGPEREASQLNDGSGDDEHEE
jgi:ribosome-binding factor A